MKPHILIVLKKSGSNRTKERKKGKIEERKTSNPTKEGKKSNERRRKERSKTLERKRNQRDVKAAKILRELCCINPRVNPSRFYLLIESNKAGKSIQQFFLRHIHQIRGSYLNIYPTGKRVDHHIRQDSRCTFR